MSSDSLLRSLNSPNGRDVSELQEIAINNTNQKDISSNPMNYNQEVLTDCLDH